MDDGAYEVSSELYEENDYTSSARPAVNQKNVVSKFPFSAAKGVATDKDGDLIVPRKSGEAVEVEHSQSTNLDLVGLQIWRGALLLADWLLHNGSSLPRSQYILELASGVGLSSVIASMFSPVICTDVDRGDILKIIQANVARNKHISKHHIEVLELDFMSSSLPEKIVALLPKISVVIAADVIYDDILTEAFVNTVQRILSVPPKRSIYVALEKRYVFTLSDCDTVAPCYEYFLDQLNKLKDVVAEEVKTDFPQYFQYERVKELVLWRITST